MNQKKVNKTLYIKFLKIENKILTKISEHVLKAILSVFKKKREKFDLEFQIYSSTGNPNMIRI